jgi:hypothetical protein
VEHDTLVYSKNIKDTVSEDQRAMVPSMMGNSLKTLNPNQQLQFKRGLIDKQKLITNRGRGRVSYATMRLSS